MRASRKVVAKKSTVPPVSTFQGSHWKHSFGLAPLFVPASMPECKGRQSLTYQFFGGAFQPKMRISKPTDEYEKEADSVAERVMRMRDSNRLWLVREDDDEELIQTKPLAQRKVGRDQENSEIPISIHNVIRSQGKPLDATARYIMESRFGFDFSRVRVHADGKAAESAQAVNSRAYTIGQHVVFGAGEYSPDTRGGQRLLAHELVHVIQQSSGIDFIQRLIRSPYPWIGVIIPRKGAHIRSSPDLRNPANILDSIPWGHTVRVLSSTGNWLRVESRYRGPVIVGYIYHTLVDDASSSSMAGSVGRTMVWRPSGPGSGTDFERWASAPTETPFPAVTSTTVMNCWEAVLLAAFRAGSINWNWIHNLYVSTPMSNWVSAMSRGARRTYSIPGPNPRMPQRGDLVFFNGLAHVALATGRGSRVYTFWPPPNTPFTAGGTTDRVKVFTIEALVAWWEVNMPPKPTVEFAAPAW